MEILIGLMLHDNEIYAPKNKRIRRLYRERLFDNQSQAGAHKEMLNINSIRNAFAAYCCRNRGHQFNYKPVKVVTGIQKPCWFSDIQKPTSKFNYDDF